MASSTSPQIPGTLRYFFPVLRARVLMFPCSCFAEEAHIARLDGWFDEEGEVKYVPPLDPTTNTEVFEGHIGIPVAPVFEDVDPSAQINALVKELKALHTENPVDWEPTSPYERCNFADDAVCLRGFFMHLDYDMDFLGTLLCASSREAANVILSAIKASSNDIMHDLKLYQEGDVPDDPAAGAKALVFYERSSSALKPHLTAEEVSFYEGMSSFLACILRKAGYSVNGNFS